MVGSNVQVARQAQGSVTTDVTAVTDIFDRKYDNKILRFFTT